MENFEIGFAVITIAAFAWTLLSAYITRKFGKPERMKEIQKEMREAGKEMSEAMKSNDAARIEQAKKRQAASIGLSMEMMKLQFKPMMIFLPLFFIFTFLLATAIPSEQDDIKAKMLDDGSAASCDAVAGDSAFSACPELSGGRAGSWLAKVKLVEHGRVVAVHSKKFAFEGNDSEAVELQNFGQEFNVSLDKGSYASGEKLVATANLSGIGNFTEVELQVDRGTRFYADLPFMIPLINAQRLDSIGWFILLLFAFGMVVTPVIKRILKW